MAKLSGVPEQGRSELVPAAPMALPYDGHSSSPDVISVITKLAEYRTIGEALFLERYASGRRPKARYFTYEGRLYPAKAVWGAAHKPPIPTRTFRTGEALAGLAVLGFLVELHTSHSPSTN